MVFSYFKDPYSISKIGIHHLQLRSAMVDKGLALIFYNCPKSASLDLCERLTPKIVKCFNLLKPSTKKCGMYQKFTKKTSAFRINPKDKGKQNHRISEEFDHLLRLCQQQQSSSASTGYWRITPKRSPKHVQLHQASPILVAQLQSTSPKKCLCLFNKGIRKARSNFHCGLWMIQRCLNDMSFTKIFDLIIINKPFSRILRATN